jgi:hypothetical protein
MTRNSRNRQTVKRTLPVQLTDEERLSRGRGIAQVLIEQQVSDEEYALERKAFNESKKQRAASIRKLRDAIKAGTEDREVECYWQQDGMEVLLIRIDTGEVVEKRQADLEERMRAEELS